MKEKLEERTTMELWKRKRKELKRNKKTVHRSLTHGFSFCNNVYRFLLCHPNHPYSRCQSARSVPSSMSSVISERRKSGADLPLQTRPWRYDRCHPYKENESACRRAERMRDGCNWVDESALSVLVRSSLLWLYRRHECMQAKRSIMIHHV